jgi:tetratricopeptide (TPR) repeat protein
MADTTEDRNLNWYAPREPVILILLSVIAALLFIGVSALAHIFRAQEAFRGDEWFNRGAVDLKLGRPQQAISDFRAALTYSRDNYDYQLRLAQALFAVNRIDEAYAYLANLWQRQPEDGSVNVELARVFAKKGDVNQALRYYHNAIYAIWKDSAPGKQRAVRLELIDFLLRQKATSQAESELIALAGDLPDDPSLRTRVGDLFMEVPDYEHALAEYRQSLKLQRVNPSAIAGAGRAAFELGHYSLAARYLQSVLSLNPNDDQSGALLQTTRLVLTMDPYQLRISTAQRNRAVVEAFKTAGERLKSCSAQRQSEPTGTAGDQRTLYSRWSEMSPRITERGLRINPDLIDDAMGVVFTVEQETSQSCGVPAGKDLALLLIGKLHEAS